MDHLFEGGIEFILRVRQHFPGLTHACEFFTFTGNEIFFLLLMPLIYWCLDRRVGARLMILFLLSTYANSAAKSTADQPRPFEYDPRAVLPLLRYPLDQVREFYGATGGGFPSGHTQNAVVVWSYLAVQFKRRWLWGLAVLMIIMVPFSRIYLAVHFPHDLLGGYVLGATILLGYLWLEPRAEAVLKELGTRWQLGIAMGIPVLLMGLMPNQTGITTGAVLLGMGVGFVLERRWLGFESIGSRWKRVCRYLLGTTVLLSLYAGLKFLFSDLEPAPLFRLVRYVLIGLWGALGAPWLFVKLRLAGRE